MQISIIIVNWNTRDLLAQCLESVARAVQSCGPNFAETIVIDNGSTDGSVAMIETDFPWVRCLQNQENIGFARANNQAIALSNSQYVLLLNSDALIPSNTLNRLYSFMEAQPDVAVVGPTLLNIDGSFQASYGQFPTISTYFWQLLGLASFFYGTHFPSASPEDSQTTQDVDWVGGACLLCRRSALATVGLLDEQFFMYAEEMEWCYRFKQHGWRVCFLPQATITHVGGGSSEIVRPKVLARQWQSNLYFLRKHHHIAAAGLIRSLVLLVGAGRAVLFTAAAMLHKQKRPQLQARAIANANLALLRVR